MTIINARPTCFYHPIRVIFLDDNRAFLDSLDLEFGDKINMLTLTSSETAFQVIDNYSQNVTQTIFKSMNDVNLDTTNDWLYRNSHAPISCGLSRSCKISGARRALEHVNTDKA